MLNSYFNPYSPVTARSLFNVFASKAKVVPPNTFKLKVKNNRSGTSKETTTVFKSNRIHGWEEVALEMKSFLQICSFYSARIDLTLTRHRFKHFANKGPPTSPMK